MTAREDKFSMRIMIFLGISANMRYFHTTFGSEK
jgi:hypothetical protein